MKEQFSKTWLNILLVILLMTTVFTACQKNEENTTAEPVDLPELVQKIYEIKDPQLSLDGASVDLDDEDALRYYTGLSSADKIEEVYFSEPQINAQAYSLVLVKVKDQADVEDIATEMKENINTSKWVCATADDLTVTTKGNLVFLCMMSSDFNEFMTSAEMAEAFKEAAP